MSINRGHQSGFPHQKEVRYYQPDVNRKWVEKVGHAKSLWKALAKVGRSRISDKAGFGNSEGDASDGTPFPHQHADACFQNGRLERNRSVATMQHPSITRHKEPSSRRRQEDKDFSLDVTFFPLDLHSSRRRISIGLFLKFFFARASGARNIYGATLKRDNVVDLHCLLLVITKREKEKGKKIWKTRNAKVGLVVAYSIFFMDSLFRCFLTVGYIFSFCNSTWLPKSRINYSTMRRASTIVVFAGYSVLEEESEVIQYHK